MTCMHVQTPVTAVSGKKSKPASAAATPNGKATSAKATTTPAAAEKAKSKPNTPAATDKAKVRPKHAAPGLTPPQQQHPASNILFLFSPFRSGL